MNELFFYISGHGFGHASRQIEIINAIGRLKADLRVVVRTSAPRWLFDRTVSIPLTLLPGECDTGVVQLDSLTLDEEATVREAAEFYANIAHRAEIEAGLLRTHGVRGVVVDAPPLACLAAARAGVPSIIVSNFTWDWIYAPYLNRRPSGSKLLNVLRSAYSHAEFACRLPMHGGFETVGSVVDVPFVARHAKRERTEVRQVLGLPPDLPLALTSFGGYGISESYLTRLDCLDQCRVVVTARGDDAVSAPAAASPGVHVVAEERLYGAGFRYEDLVHAVDVVVTKPGYGIIAECIANDTAILYTSRGGFAEYDVLVREMPRYLRCDYIDQDSLFAGRWRGPLARLLSSPPAPERPPTNGADVVARMITEITRES